MDISELYKNVFDDEGNIKLCGRDACKALILACEEKTGRKGEFGNPETGWMEPEKIKELMR